MFATILLIAAVISEFIAAFFKAAARIGSVHLSLVALGLFFYLLSLLVGGGVPFFNRGNSA